MAMLPWHADGALCQPLSYIVEAEKQYDIDGTTYSYGDDYFCLPNTFVGVWPSMANATTVVSPSCFPHPRVATAILC